MDPEIDRLVFLNLRFDCTASFASFVSGSGKFYVWLDMKGKSVDIREGIAGAQIR